MKASLQNAQKVRDDIINLTVKPHQYSIKLLTPQ